jgi:IS1 family transposase
MASTTTANTTTITDEPETKQLSSSLCCPKVAPAPAAGTGEEEEAYECLSSSSSGGGSDDDDDSSIEGTGGAGAEVEDGGLVQRVAAYFFESETFADTFEQWVRANASRIDLATTECRLEYTQLFEEFKALFEAEMTGFIEAQGATIEDFYEALARKSAADPWSNEGVFAQILVAVVDWDVFMAMMREAAEKDALARAKTEREGKDGEAEEGKEGEAK